MSDAQLDRIEGQLDAIFTYVRHLVNGPPKIPLQYAPETNWGIESTKDTIKIGCQRGGDKPAEFKKAKIIENILNDDEWGRASEIGGHYWMCVSHPRKTLSIYWEWFKSEPGGKCLAEFTGPDYDSMISTFCHYCMDPDNDE
jgi:hypothetical protein